MNIGDIVVISLTNPYPLPKYLRLVYKYAVRSYFKKVYNNYSVFGIFGVPKLGGFPIEGVVQGPVYAHPMANNGYGVSYVNCPPANFDEIDNAFKDKDGMWPGLFEYTARYFLKCSAILTNPMFVMEKPFVIGFDNASISRNPLNAGQLRTIASTLPQSFRSAGFAFKELLKTKQPSDTKVMWKMFGDAIDDIVRATFNWVWVLETQAPDGVFHGTLTTAFTKLP